MKLSSVYKKGAWGVCYETGRPGEIELVDMTFVSKERAEAWIKHNKSRYTPLKVVRLVLDFESD